MVAQETVTRRLGGEGCNCSRSLQGALELGDEAVQQSHPGRRACLPDRHYDSRHRTSLSDGAAAAAWSMWRLGSLSVN